MSDVAEPVAVALGHPVAPEDRARADLYALLARLYAAAPDASLLAAIAAAPALGPATLTDDIESKTARLGETWERLKAASAAMDAEAAEQEYTDLFLGVGKSEVNLHASHWRTGFMMEKPLVDVRADLAEMGLARKPGVTMVEDHLSALYETMRLLVGGDEDRAPAALAEQKAFFERHVAPWAESCCAELIGSSIANYYRRVAEFTIWFMALERDSFAMF